MTTFQVVNPHTGQAAAPHPSATSDVIERRLASVDRAWKERPMQPDIAQKVALVRRIADLHRQRRMDLAKIVVREMGKPILQAVGEVDFCEGILALLTYPRVNTTNLGFSGC